MVSDDPSITTPDETAARGVKSLIGTAQARRSAIMLSDRLSEQKHRGGHGTLHRGRHGRMSLNGSAVNCR